MKGKITKTKLSAIKNIASRMPGVVFKCFKKTLFFLDSHANLLVALATLFLAFLTLKYISVTTKMAEETKRLADSNIEQFKIKSYPVFLVVTQRITFESGRLVQRFNIHNKGEITAHNVTFLLVNVYKNKSELFVHNTGTYYEVGKTRRSIDIETKIQKDSFKWLVSETSLPKEYGFDDLKHALLFIKFKVPYDTVYRRIEVFGFILDRVPEKEKERLYIWQELSPSDCSDLVRRHQKISFAWSEQVNTFFKNSHLEMP